MNGGVTHRLIHGVTGFKKFARRPLDVTNGQIHQSPLASCDRM